MIIWFLSSRALCLNLPFRASAGRVARAFALVCRARLGASDRQCRERRERRLLADCVEKPLGIFAEF
jgi:hypothetical protein